MPVLELSENRYMVSVGRSVTGRELMRRNRPTRTGMTPTVESAALGSGVAKREGFAQEAPPRVTRAERLRTTDSFMRQCSVFLETSAKWPRRFNDYGPTRIQRIERINADR